MPDGYYLEEDGLVKVQFEDIMNGSRPPSGWVYQNRSNGDNPGFEGDGYYYWKNEDSTALDSRATQGLITTTVFIQDPGTYTLFLRSTRDSNGPSDARNDIWVNIDGDTTDVLPPRSPRMVETDGFVKLYGASTGWGFSRNFDDLSTDRNPVSNVVLSEGFHTITFAGRSQGYHIDSFQLSKSGTPNTSLESSRFITDDAPTPPPAPPVVPPSANERPDALNDTATTEEGRAVSINVQANDSDPNGDALTLSITSGADNGSVRIADGRIVYTPDAGFTGTDDFFYRATDSGGLSDKARVTVTVSADDGGTTPPPPPPPVAPPSANERPDALNDTATTEEGRAVSINVQANDSDPNGDALTLSITSGADNGSVRIADGRIVYTPDAGFTGTDDFFYRATDSGGLSDKARVTVTVSADDGGTTPPPPPPPPGDFTAPFDTSADAFGFGDVDLYGFGTDGEAAPVGASGGSIGVRDTGSASEIDFRPGSGGEMLGFDFGAPTEGATIRLGSLANIGGAKEAGLLRTFDADGDLMETYTLKDATRFELDFDAPVRYATLEASDWVDGTDPGFDPDISLVGVEVDYIL